MHACSLSLHSAMIRGLYFNQTVASLHVYFLLSLSIIEFICPATKTTCCCRQPYTHVLALKVNLPFQFATIQKIPAKYYHLFWKISVDFQTVIYRLANKTNTDRFYFIQHIPITNQHHTHPIQHHTPPEAKASPSNTTTHTIHQANQAEEPFTKNCNN
jgi:hypothetical protein